MGDNKGEQGKTKIENEGVEKGEREEEWQKYVTWQFYIHTHTITRTHTCHASYLSDSHHRNYDTMTFARAAGGGNRNLKMFAVGELYIL